MKAVLWVCLLECRSETMWARTKAFVLGIYWVFRTALETEQKMALWMVLARARLMGRVMALLSALVKAREMVQRLGKL